MRIVRLTPDEAPRLRAIRLAALEDAPDAFGSTYEKAAAQKHELWVRGLTELPTFVAETDGRDVGLVRGAEDRFDETTAWLISMWVAPTHRGQGIGEALITTVADWARSEGYVRMKLDVADGNPAAIRLYERMGFEPDGEVGHLPPPREHITEHRRVLEL